jgi:hypothetical protein
MEEITEDIDSLTLSDSMFQSWNQTIEPSVPYSSLQLFYLFVNLDGNLFHTLQEVISIDPGSESIPFGTLHTHIRKACSSLSGIPFQLSETLFFDLDIDHDDVLPFLQSTDLEEIVDNHLHVIPFLDTIELHSAPSYLHSANSIFFILKQKEPAKKPKLQISEETNETIPETQDVVLNRTKKHYSNDSNSGTVWKKRVIRGTRKHRSDSDN